MPSHNLVRRPRTHSALPLSAARNSGRHAPARATGSPPRQVVSSWCSLLPQLNGLINPHSAPILPCPTGKSIKIRGLLILQLHETHRQDDQSHHEIVPNYSSALRNARLRHSDGRFSSIGRSQEPLGRPFFETGLGSVKKGWIAGTVIGQTSGARFGHRRGRSPTNHPPISNFRWRNGTRCLCC